MNKLLGVGLVLILSACGVSQPQPVTSNPGDGTSTTPSTPSTPATVPSTPSTPVTPSTPSTPASGHPTLTVSGPIDIYHLHHADVSVTTSGFGDGEINLRIVGDTADSPIELQSTVAAGNRTQTQTFYASGLPASTDINMNPALLTQHYRLIASQKGVDLASTDIVFREKLLTMTATLTPSPVDVHSGEQLAATLTVTFSPPLEPGMQDVPLIYLGSPSTTGYLEGQDAGPVTGGGAKLSRPVTLSVFTYDAPPSASLNTKFSVSVGDFAYLRAPWYPDLGAEIVTNLR